MPPPPSSPTVFANFGDLLKFLRRREQLTQLELSIAVGYSEAQISRLEKNQRLPDLTAVKALFVPALHLENDPQLVSRFWELAQSARQEDAPAPGIPPYKGLPFFDESDADLFFGREALTTRLVNRVTDLAINSSTRFLTIVGASGSGKSSLVRAGLAVTLRQQGWETHVFTPTANSLKMLESQTNASRIDLNSGCILLLVDQFEEIFTLCSSETERITFIEKLLFLAQYPSTQVTVVIALRADFYSHCAQYPFLRQVIATEQEYIGQMNLEELRRAIEEPALRGGWELEPGLIEVLLNDIAADGAQGPEPGALPLLSHALLSTWDHRRGRLMTLDGYRAAGGVRHAIAETAENVFADQLNQKQQELAHDVFLRLTELGEGTEDTRRRAALNELVRQSEEAIQLRTVLNMLAEARLITLNEDSAEVAHEALIRQWRRLHEWLTHDREGLRLHRHLTEAAREWEALEHDPGSLYRGARLAQAYEWSLENQDRLNESEWSFLKASVEQEQRDALEREAQRQHELEAARKLAETEHRSATRLRRRNQVIVAVCAVAFILATMAGLFGIQSETNFTRAEAQRLAAEANGLYKTNGSSELIALLALQSIYQQYSPQGDEALANAAMLSYPLQIFQGHTKVVWGAALSPDGKQALTGSEDGTARLWDRQTGQEIRQFSCPNLVYQVAFSPDGRTILTNCGDPSIRLWDPQTGEQLYKFSPGDFTDQPVFSLDGKYVIAASRNAVVWRWDVNTGQLVQRFNVPVSKRSRLFISPDGKYVLTQAFSDNVVRLWSLGETITEVRSLPFDDLYLWSVTFSSNNRYILVGYSGGTVLVWDIVSGQIVQRLQGHTSAVTGITFSPDGEKVLTGSADKSVRLWDWRTGSELLRLGQPNQVYASAFSVDGRYVLAGANDGTVRLWDIQTHPKLPVFKGHASVVSALSFSPDGKLLATGGSDGMRLWDIGSGQLLRTFPEAGYINYGVKFSPVGRNLVSGNWAGIASFWDLSTGQKVKQFALPTLNSSGINDLAFSPDGKRILVGGFDDSIFSIAQVWDIATGKIALASFVGHKMSDGVTRVAFSPDGQYLLTAHQGGLIRLWDSNAGTSAGEFVGHIDTVNSAVFSPDGKYIATASNDKTVRLWNVETKEEIRQFTGHTDTVWSVIFAANGKTFATGSADGTARLWDVQSGKELRRFVGHTAGVENLAFSPDGKYLATVGDDGTARLWDVDYHATMEYLCSQLLRDLTDAERTQYNITDTSPTCPGS